MNPSLGPPPYEDECCRGGANPREAGNKGRQCGERDMLRHLELVGRNDGHRKDQGTAREAKAQQSGIGDGSNERADHQRPECNCIQIAPFAQIRCVDVPPPPALNLQCPPDYQTCCDGHENSTSGKQFG
jgi:hypothetical protein